MDLQNGDSQMSEFEDDFEVFVNNSSEDEDHEENDNDNSIPHEIISSSDDSVCSTFDNEASSDSVSNTKSVPPKNTFSAHFENDPSSNHSNSSNNMPILSVGSNLQFSCEFCSEKCSNAFDLKLHTRALHFASDLCPYCKRDFPTFDHMVMHCVAQHPGAKLTCDVCAEQFLTQALMLEHRLRHVWEEFPGENVYRFECPSCKVRVQDREAYKIHTEIHASTQTQNGKSDNQVSLSEGSAQPSNINGEDSVTVSNNICSSIKFECPICQESVQDLGDFNIHMNVVHNIGSKDSHGQSITNFNSRSSINYADGNGHHDAFIRQNVKVEEPHWFRESTNNTPFMDTIPGQVSTIVRINLFN